MSEFDAIRKALDTSFNFVPGARSLKVNAHVALAALEQRLAEAEAALSDPCARAGRHVCGPLADEDAAGWQARAEAAEYTLARANKASA